MSPSDEDSQTFIINASSGETYKLKGKVTVYLCSILLLTKFLIGTVIAT